MTDPATTIVVHGRCADGITSAGLLLRKLPHAKVVYGQPADLADGLERLAADATVARLVLADLSPQPTDLPRIKAALATIRTRGPVTWIDHHAPQWPPEFEVDVKALGVEVLLDRTQTQSGASLAAVWTKEKDPAILRVADHIRMRDAWTDPHNPVARAWTLVAADKPEEYVAALSSGRLDGLEERGRDLLREKEESIARSLAAVRRHSLEVAYLWGEDDVSDVADRLFREDTKVVLLVRFGPSGRASIRSRPERPVAATLGQAYGGGGHANAAGFSFKIGWWRRLVLRLRRARDPVVRQALDRADAIART